MPATGSLERHSLDQAGDSTVRAPARRRAHPSDASALPAAASRASIERSRRHPKRRAHPTWTDRIINRSSVDATRSTPTSSITGPPPVAAVLTASCRLATPNSTSYGSWGAASRRNATRLDCRAAASRWRTTGRSSSSGVERALERTTVPIPRWRFAPMVRAGSRGDAGRVGRVAGGADAGWVDLGTTHHRRQERPGEFVVTGSSFDAGSGAVEARQPEIDVGGTGLDAGSDHMGARRVRRHRRRRSDQCVTEAEHPGRPHRIGGSYRTGSSCRPRRPTTSPAIFSGQLAPTSVARPRHPTTRALDRPGETRPPRRPAQRPRQGPIRRRAAWMSPPPLVGARTVERIAIDRRPASGGLRAAAPTVDQRSAVALAERVADAMTPTPATATRPTATTTTTPTPQTSPTAYTTPTTPTTPTTTTVTGATKQRLRAQRLLRSGLVTDTSASDTFATGETSNQTTADAAMARTMAPTMAPTIEPVRTSASIDTVEARSLPTLSPARRPVLDERLPSLARVDSTPSTLIRRVTLPRALSSTHRPASQLAPFTYEMCQAPLVRPVRSRARRYSGHRRSASAARYLDAGGDDHQREPNSSGAPWESPTTSAAGPLLQVVRRIAATDVAAAASPYTATTAATTTPTPSEAMNVAGGEALTGARTSRTRRTAASTASSTATAATANSTATAPSTVTAAAANSTAAGAVARSTAAAVAATARAGALAEVMRSVAPGQSDANGGATPDAALPSEPTAQAPAERVADQFMSVLSETMRSRPTPLPTTYRPLADAIAGPRPVMLSTDTASRKALRSVGKVAATTGDTIHLDRQAIPSARLDEVMAHELTHVAHPSPAPRFFDDIDDSPEERRAEQVAKVMARSPLAPSATTSAPPERRRRDTSTIRRSPATSAPSVQSARARFGVGTALAASLTGGRSPAARTSSSAGKRRRRRASDPVLAVVVVVHVVEDGASRSVRIGRRTRTRRPSGSASNSTPTSIAWCGCSKTG